MLRNARTAVRFLVYGIITGVLFAPQDGADTRKQLMSLMGDTLNDAITTRTGGEPGTRS